MKKRFLILLSGFFILISNGQAQSFFKIYGVVKNEKNVPLTGARLLFKVRQTTGVTDTTGWFSAVFFLPCDTIQVSYPDYKTVLIPLNKKTKFPIHIVMFKE